jgi:hypothetical protein
MKSSILIAVIILAATGSLHAQSLLEIEPGWPRDSAMKMLKGKYRVADTVVIPGRNYDEIIRMAPVDLAGYGGYLVLHSDSLDNVTSIVWVRARYNIFQGDPFPWSTFRDWETWKVPTGEEYRTILQSIAPRYNGWKPGAYVVDYEGQHDSISNNYTNAWFSDTASVTYIFSPGQEFSEIRFVREMLMSAWPGVTDTPLKEQDSGDGE